MKSYVNALPATREDLAHHPERDEDGAGHEDGAIPEEFGGERFHRTFVTFPLSQSA